jgi:RNA polymerase sigma factor (sigma-70 family)
MSPGEHDVGGRTGRRRIDDHDPEQELRPETSESETATHYSGVSAEQPADESGTTDGTDRCAELFRDHSKHIVRYLQKLGADHATAEDLAQETFVTALLHIDELPDRPVGWLLVTARNRHRDAVRRSNVAARYVKKQSIDLEGALAPSRQRHDEDDIVENNVILAFLHHLTKQECETYLVAVLLRPTAAEGARRLGISETTYTGRLGRARKRIRALLASGQIEL